MQILLDCKFEHGSLKRNIAESLVLLHCSIGRFPTLKKSPHFKGRTLEVRSKRLTTYQLCNLYGVIFMTKDHHGSWTKLQLTQIFSHYFNCDPPMIPDSLTVTLADADDELTQDVAAIAEDERYKPWIKNSAEDIVNRYFIESLKQEPRFITAR